MASDPHQLFDDIAADVAQELDRVGGEIVLAIQEDLSIPVEVSTGPRGGRVVKRSLPGEHPRIETGKLRAGVYHEVQRDGAEVNLTVSNDVEYSKYLDPSGEQGLQNRPITDGQMDRFEPVLTEVVANAISGTA